jgi:putative hydrolase of the HAD superfamily
MTRAITFDATRTLIHSPRLIEIYREVLERHGIEAPAAEVRRLIPVVWQEMDCRTEIGRDRFSAHPEGPRGWWRRFLERLCEHLGSPALSPFAAAELYHRFGRAEAWEVYPEVPATLDALSRLGLRMAVVSNWDERLPPLLDSLGIGRRFDAVVFSAAVGVEKPDPRIFRHALERLGVPPEEAVHVGDSVREDVEGALAAGMEALHLVRPGAPSLTRLASRGGDRGERGDLAELSPLPDLIEISRAPAPFPLPG